tara:strand:+ start:13770 stop:14657 length:888 start_codon:yes stop_codon:yes gene_type:complete
MPLNKGPYVIVDGDNELYRAFYKHERMTHSDLGTGALFGMPRSISSIIKKLKPAHITIAWDGKRDKRRIEITPDYKKGPTRLGKAQAKEDAFRQKDILRNLFEKLGIDQAHRHNIEGDDHIYMVVREWRKAGRDIIIVSSDKDFRQLISPKVSIWNDRMNKMTTYDNCKELHGYASYECSDTLCLVGDTSDNLKGYPGVGDKTAEKFLMEFGSIKKFLKDKNLTFKRIDRKTLKSVYGEMREMVNLKYFYLKNIKGNREVTIYKGNKDRDKYLAICKKHGLKTHQGSNFINTFKL